MVSRSISVATVIKHDGHDLLGIYGSGDNVKSHGIRLTNAKVCKDGHVDGETVTQYEPTCTSVGRKVTLCSKCGAITKTEQPPALGHTDSEWVVKSKPTCTEDGERVKICPVCLKEWSKEAIPAPGYHTLPDEWEIKTYNNKPYLGVRYKRCTACGEIVINERYFDSSLWDNPYTDVFENSWFREAAAFVSGYEYMTGTSENLFSPDVKMTRAMFVLVLGKMSSIRTSDYKSSQFTDVRVGTWYAPYVQWAVEKGIVAGIGDLKFAPDNMITREQLAVMMYRYTEVFGGDLKYDDNVLDSYSDKDDISDYAVTALKWAVSKGLISGMTSETVGPKGVATRAQVAVIVMKFHDSVYDTMNK